MQNEKYIGTPVGACGGADPMLGDPPPGADPMMGGDPMGGMGESPGPVSNDNAFIAVMRDINAAVQSLVITGVSPDTALNVAKEVWNKIINKDIVAFGAAVFACDKMPTVSYELGGGDPLPHRGAKQGFQRTVRNDPKSVLKAQCAMQEKAARKAATPHDTLREIVRTSGLTSDQVYSLASEMLAAERAKKG